MSTFQLDECMDAKWLVKECERQGLADVWRYPRRLKTKESRQKGAQKDQAILPGFLSQDRPFVTTDKTIICDNISVISDYHCGIIIISNATPTPSVSRADLEKIPRDGKVRFPEWHTVSWRNSIVEITEAWVRVGRVSEGCFKKEAPWFFTEPDWKVLLLIYLKKNADSLPSLPDSKD